MNVLWALLFTLSGPDFHDVALHLKFSNGVCSGTAVGQRVVLTAAHCINSESPLVSIDDRPVKVVSMINDGRDHVLMRVDIEFKSWASLGVPPRQGEHLRWIGNPIGFKDFYREGYVVNADGAMIFIDAPIIKGDSGAGLFDWQGRVVGVVSQAAIWTFPEYQVHLTVAQRLAFTPEQWAAVK